MVIRSLIVASSDKEARRLSSLAGNVPRHRRHVEYLPLQAGQFLAHHMWNHGERGCLPIFEHGTGDCHRCEMAILLVPVCNLLRHPTFVNTQHAHTHPLHSHSPRLLAHPVHANVLRQRCKEIRGKHCLPLFLARYYRGRKANNGRMSGAYIPCLPTSSIAQPQVESTLGSLSVLQA